VNGRVFELRLAYYDRLQVGGRAAHYALEGSVAITGALVQWLRDNLGIIERARMWRRWREQSTTMAAFSLSRRFPDCMRRIGRRMRVVSLPADALRE